MINTDAFIKRLEIILDYYSLSASGFADKIGVQRSSISHLLSGRNKPSLDFILKIIEIYPDVDLYWILNGIGDFPKSDKNLKPAIDQNKFIPPVLNLETKKNEKSNLNTGSLFQNQYEDKKTENQIDPPEIQIAENLINENKKELVQDIKISQNKETIEKIVFFYTNGSFKEFNPK